MKGRKIKEKMGKKLRHRHRGEFAKFVEPSIEGKCPYCHKHVKNLEAHIKAKHKGEKLPEKQK